MDAARTITAIVFVDFFHGFVVVKIAIPVKKLVILYRIFAVKAK